MVAVSCSQAWLLNSYKYVVSESNEKKSVTDMVDHGKLESFLHWFITGFQPADL